MFVLIGLLACGSEEKNNGEDTAQNTTDMGEEEVVPPFRPLEGHWTYSGGSLVEANTTCTLPNNDPGDLTDPVGFALALGEAGDFTITSDGDEAGTLCVLNDPESTQAGGFQCSSASSSIVFEDIDDGIGGTLDITMQIDTALQGLFASDSAMQNTFTLTLTCTDVDHWSGASCSDIQEQFPNPCDIQFNANATLDVE